jgi:low affinity Fe/Cu permease
MRYRVLRYWSSASLAATPRVERLVGVLLRSRGWSLALVGQSSMKFSPSTHINSLAGFLSTAVGFMATTSAVLLGIGIGWAVHFSDDFMLVFNLLLSIAAIVISSVILVANARSEGAIQVKLDRLIEFSKASNTVIGLEHKDVAEIEAERQAVEKEASELDQHIEQEVEEEVTEQLDERGVGR